MIAKKQVSPNELDDNIYDSESTSSILKIISLALLMLALGLLLNFSISKSIENKVVQALSSNAYCSIAHDKLNLKLLFPSLNIQQMNIPASCFQSQGQSIKLDSLNFYLSGISFYPFGLKFSGEALSDDVDIKSSISLGLPRPMFKLHESRIDMKVINSIISKPNLLKGQLILEAQGELSGAEVESANLLLKATQLSLPTQNINGLKLPTLNFGEAASKMRLVERTQLNIDEFILGNNNAPIVGKMSGQILLNQANINTSRMELGAEVKFAPEFVESFPIINLFLNNKEINEDGFYILELTGPVGSPNFQ